MWWEGGTHLKVSWGIYLSVPDYLQEVKPSAFPDYSPHESCTFGVTVICARPYFIKVTEWWQRGRCCWEKNLVHTFPKRREQAVPHKDLGEALAPEGVRGKQGADTRGWLSWERWAGLGTAVLALPGPGTEGRRKTGLVYELDTEVAGGMASGLVGGFVRWFSCTHKAGLQGRGKQLSPLVWLCDHGCQTDTESKTIREDRVLK